MARTVLIAVGMKTSIKVMAAFAAAVLLLGGVAFWVFNRGRDLSTYEVYRDPKLLAMPPQPMLVLRLTGDPTVVGPAVFKQLFSLYDQVDGASKGAPPAPRARCGTSLDAPKEQWLGRYAVPLPPGITKVPAPALLQTWSYGEVAQVLYEGPYDDEMAAIQGLRAFIVAQGYEIDGEHEEEYLRGPTMFGRGDPRHYLTLIRYEVKPRPPAQANAGEVESGDPLFSP